MPITRLPGAEEAVVELLTPVGEGRSLSGTCSAKVVGVSCVVASVVWQLMKGRRPLVFHADLLYLIFLVVERLGIRDG